MASRLSILVVFGIFLQYCPVDLLPGGFIPKFRGLPTFFNRLDKKHPTIYTISSNIPENACGYSMAILIPFIPGKNLGRENWPSSCRATGSSGPVIIFTATCASLIFLDTIMISWSIESNSQQTWDHVLVVVEQCQKLRADMSPKWAEETIESPWLIHTLILY